MTEATIIEVPLSADERKQLLDRVEDIQRSRASQVLRPVDVPHVLLPYQARWHEDRSPIRMGQKSRRVGWSWGGLAAEAVLEAGAQRSAGGMDQHYMGYNKDMAAEFIGDCAFFARSFQEVLSSSVFSASRIGVRKEIILIEDERRDLITYSVRLASGFTIEALSSNPNNWRGRQGHARIDEAAFHVNLREVIKGALAFLMWGGRLDVVSTHNGEDNDFNVLVKQVRAGKLPWSLHTITFDDALADGFFRRVCLVRGQIWTPEAEAQYRADTYAGYPNQEDADEELGAIPKRGGGSYFPRSIIEQCWVAGIPVLRFSQPDSFVLDRDRLIVGQAWFDAVVKPVIDAMPKDRRTVFGQDFGRSGDLSVIWVLQETASGAWRTVFILELRRIPFDVQQLILFAVLWMLPHFFHGKMDARGNGQSHAEAAMQTFGPERIDCVMLSIPWYALWFPRYRRAYEDRDIIVPLVEDIATDHRRVKLVNGKPTMDDGHDKGSDGEQRHGDTAVAGLLAWAATTMEAVEHAYTPAYPRGSDEAGFHRPHHDDDDSPFRHQRCRFGRGAF